MATTHAHSNGKSTKSVPPAAKAAAAAAVEATTTKKTRGKGPCRITFEDDSGQEHIRRVPLNVAAVVVSDNAGKIIKYDPRKLHADSRFARDAVFLRQRINSAMMANKEGKHVHDVASAIFADAVEGRMYNKSEEKKERKAKSKYDLSSLVAAVRRYNGDQVKAGQKHPKTGKAIPAMSDEAAAMLLDKFNSSPKAIRMELEARYMGNTMIKAYYHAEVANKARREADKEDLGEIYDFDE